MPRYRRKKKQQIHDALKREDEISAKQMHPVAWHFKRLVLSVCRFFVRNWKFLVRYVAVPLITAGSLVTVGLVRLMDGFLLVIITSHVF